MRKALVLTVLYLFGSEAVAQKSFRHAPTVALDDVQDSEMFIGNGNRIGSTIYNPGNPLGQGPLINRPLPPIPRNAFDDVEDNEMALNLNMQGAARDAIRLANNDYRVKVGRWDAAEDDEMFRFDRPPVGSTPPFNPTPVHKFGFDYSQDNEMALNLNSQSAVRDAVRLGNNDYRVKVGRWDAAEDDEMFNLDRRPAGSPPPYRPTTRGGFDDAQDDEMFGVPLGNGGSGIYASGGSARGGGVAWGGVGQYSHNIGKNTALIGGATVSHYPGSKVNIAPHVGVKFSFDDENDDQLFAEDDELFGVPLGNGGSGIYASGGSARGGGVAWGGVGQYSHNIGKNTALIGGATVSHYPGSKVNIAPHVGVKFSFDDEEQN